MDATGGLVNRASRVPGAAKQFCFGGFQRTGCAAVRAKAAHQSLRGDETEHGRDEEAVHAEVDEAGDRADGGIGVQGAEDEVAGECGTHGDVGGFTVADFADHDDIGIMTQDAAQGFEKGDFVRAHDHLGLGDAFDVELDGIFHGHDVAQFAREDMADGGVKGGAFAAAGGAGEQDDAVGKAHGLFEAGALLRVHAEPVEGERGGFEPEQTQGEPLAVTRWDAGRAQFHGRQRSAGLEVAQEEAARLICSESGLCLRETRHEVGRALAVLRLAAVATRMPEGEIFADDILPGGRGRRTYTQREPFRLTLAITPFNHPLNQVTHKLAPAFAVGTPVVLKPSAHTPLSAFWFGELCLQAGLPPDWLTVLCAPDLELPRALVAHPEFQMLAFTGGTAAGREIAGRAGYKKIVLELGGSSPMLVLDDAPFDEAVGLAAQGCFRNSGQRCTAIRRILVPRAMAEDFAVALGERAASLRLGPPLEETTEMGTVIHAAAAEQIAARVRQAVADGARLHHPCNHEGARISPCVLSGVNHDMDIVSQETFGPVAPVIGYADFAEALNLANRTAYGLSAAVVGRDWNRIQQAISTIEAGSVNVNAEPGWRMEWTPFGGIKASGMGDKEGVLRAMDGLSWTKTYSLPWDRP